METNTIHNPARLEGETQQEYKFRRHLSQRVAERGTLLFAPTERQPWAKASIERVKLRKLTRTLGRRQLKLLIREQKDLATS